MKKLLMPTIVMLALATAGSALAAIDWAGQVWPNNNATVVPTGPVDVYAQVYKNGVTTNPGQGPDISAVMYYTTDLAPQASVAMTFLGDAGASNDEYTAQVPQSALAGAAWVDVTITFTDATDGTDYVVSADQAGNPPPFRYNVTNVLPNDVEVGFRLCLSGEVTAGDVCVIGSNVALGNWGTGVVMNHDGGDSYGVTVVIPAGSNPTFEYKYKKDGCATWEGVPNRAVTLPTDGTTYFPLPDVDSWNNAPLGCGLGSTLVGERVVCFQVCLTGIATAGDVCVIGNHGFLGNWGTGVTMTPLGGDLYQACIVFPAGMAAPINLEFKFQKDGCSSWESVGNRLFTVSNALAPVTTLTHVWDDGVGACDPVDVERESWGGLKSLFR